MKKNIRMALVFGIAATMASINAMQDNEENSLHSLQTNPESFQEKRFFMNTKDEKQRYVLSIFSRDKPLDHEAKLLLHSRDPQSYKGKEIIVHMQPLTSTPTHVSLYSLLLPRQDTQEKEESTMHNFVLLRTGKHIKNCPGIIKSNSKYPNQFCPLESKK